MSPCSLALVFSDIGLIYMTDVQKVIFSIEHHYDLCRRFEKKEKWTFSRSDILKMTTLPPSAPSHHTHTSFITCPLKMCKIGKCK